MENIKLNNEDNCNITNDCLMPTSNEDEIVEDFKSQENTSYELSQVPNDNPSSSSEGIIASDICENAGTKSENIFKQDTCEVTTDREDFDNNNIKKTVTIEKQGINGNGHGTASGDTMEISSEEIDENYSYDIGYDFSRNPVEITKSLKEFSVGKNNFTKGCKWAPDGSCILTCSDDNKLRLFNLPSELWDPSQWSNTSELEAVLRISEGDCIYDYCWYPLMNSNDPSTCCLVSTSRKSTVHMWDAYTGELRCSYRSFNHLDELVTPTSICFDSDGERLFCGYHNIVRIFDVNRPGRLCVERQIYAYKTGQCGIISCFAFTSTDKNISAAGSYKGTIGLYAEPNGELLSIFEGQRYGITQLQFSPDGNYLYSVGRKHPEILCWDIRNVATVLFSMNRHTDTNQRIYFDLSRCGRYIVSGNQSGIITFWDVTQEPKITNETNFPVLVPVHYFMAHRDCVNGISFHPSFPILCSSSGQRKFPVLQDDDSEDIFSFDTQAQDNSLRLWWIGKLPIPTT